MKLSIAAESQIIDIFSFSLSAEVGLFGSSILWPVLCSVLCVGEIAPPLASYPGRCSCKVVSAFFCLAVLAEVTACHLRQLVHEASADVTCG